MVKLKSKLPEYRGVDLEQKDIDAFRVSNLLSAYNDDSFESEICELEKTERAAAKMPVFEGLYSIPPCVMRGIMTQTPADGGYLISSENAPSFAHHLYAQSVILPRATVLMDLSSNISVVRETGEIKAVWGGEAAAVTRTSTQLSSVGLSPKELNCETVISAHLARQSDPSAESMVRQSMMRSFAESFDRAILYGAGQNFEPSGLVELDRIKNDPHPGVVEYDAEVPPYRDQLSEACQAIGRTNAADMLTWLTGWRFHTLASQRYALIENQRILDIDVVPSSAVAEPDAWLGNWQYLVAAIWGGMDIGVDRNSLLDSGQIRVVGHYRVDAAPMYPDAFMQIKPRA